MQEGTKVLTLCVQLVVESFDNVCRQRRGGRDVVLLCCEANCTSTTDSLAVSGGGRGGRGLVPPESCTAENVGGGVVRCVEEGEENITCILSHLTCICHSENGMEATVSGGTSNVRRGLHPHMQYTCYTSH